MCMSHKIPLIVYKTTENECCCMLCSCKVDWVRTILICVLHSMQSEIEIEQEQQQEPRNSIFRVRIFVLVLKCKFNLWLHSKSVCVWSFFRCTRTSSSSSFAAHWYLEHISLSFLFSFDKKIKTLTKSNNSQEMCEHHNYLHKNLRLTQIWKM